MDKISQAFENIHREDFVPAHSHLYANIDAPLPIGYGQTISQLSTVKSMLRWLDAKEGDYVLDIGSGSGWTTALLSCLVGPKGRVFAVEIIPELLKFGQTNCKNIGIKNAKFFQAGESYGLAEFSPYDRILVSASARDFPNELLNQLKTGGKLIIPVGGNIFEVIKTSKDKSSTTIHPGYVFVPLV